MTRVAKEATGPKASNSKANFLEKIGFRAAATNLVKMHLSVMWSAESFHNYPQGFHQPFKFHFTGSDLV